jgi:hypothetical protein
VGHEVEVVKSLVVIKFLKSKLEVDAISLDLSKSVYVHLRMWLRLLFQVVFHLKIHQNNIFFISFLISTDQNDLKTLKNINLK